MKGLNPDKQTLPSGVQNKGKQAVAAGGGGGAAAPNDADADLEARLEALRRQ